MERMAESKTGGDRKDMVVVDNSNMPSVEAGKRKATEEVQRDHLGKKERLEGKRKGSPGPQSNNESNLSVVAPVVSPQKMFPAASPEVVVGQSEDATSCQNGQMKNDNLKERKGGSPDLRSSNESEVIVAAPVVSPIKGSSTQPPSQSENTTSGQHNQVLCGSCKTFRNIAAMDKYFECNNLCCNGRIQDFFRDDVNTGQLLGVYPNVTLEQKNCMEALRKQSTSLLREVLDTTQLSVETVGRLWRMGHVAKKAAIFEDDSYKSDVTKHLGLLNALSNMERALDRKDKVAFRGFYHTAMYMILVGYSHVNEVWKKEGASAHHSAGHH